VGEGERRREKARERKKVRGGWGGKEREREGANLKMGREVQRPEPVGEGLETRETLVP